MSMSYFWKAGINLQFNGSKYEENINVEPVPGFYLLGQGGSQPNVSSPPPPPPPQRSSRKKWKLFHILILFDDDIKESVKAINVQECNFSQFWALSFPNFPGEHALHAILELCHSYRAFLASVVPGVFSTSTLYFFCLSSQMTQILHRIILE